MSYRTLLAHLPSERTAPHVLHAAATLATAHGAHLIGMHVMPSVELYGPHTPLPAEVARRFHQTRAEIAERIHGRFEEVCAGAEFVAEWRRTEHVRDSVAHSVVELGDTCDLLVLAHDDEEPQRTGGHERIIALSARPVLLVPDAAPLDTLGRRVFVAWDGSREATAAVFGALPLLERADEVRLHRINPPRDDRPHGSGAGEQLAANLARHGVKVEYARSDAHAGETGGELLGFAADMGADLMTMGCYGHSKLREFLLGGTTRHVLAEAELPLLLHG